MKELDPVRNKSRSSVTARERGWRERVWKEEAEASTNALEELMRTLPEDLKPFATGETPIPPGESGDEIRARLHGRGFKFGSVLDDGEDVESFSLPPDFSSLTQFEYNERRLALEKNMGKVNRGILQFLGALERVWFDKRSAESRRSGLLAKYLVRSIRDEGYRVLRESMTVVDKGRYINALLALEDRGIVRDMNPLGKPRRDVLGEELKLDEALIGRHIEAFLSLETHRRLEAQAEQAVKAKSPDAERLKRQVAELEATPEFRDYKAEFGKKETRTIVEMLGNRLWEPASRMPIEESELSKRLNQMHAERDERRKRDIETMRAQASPEEIARAEAFGALVEDADRRVRWGEWALEVMHRTPDLTSHRPETELGLGIVYEDVHSAYKELEEELAKIPTEVAHPGVRHTWGVLERRAHLVRARAATVVLEIGQQLGELSLKDAQSIKRNDGERRVEQKKGQRAPIDVMRATFGQEKPGKAMEQLPGAHEERVAELRSVLTVWSKQNSEHPDETVKENIMHLRRILASRDRGAIEAYYDLLKKMSE